VMVASAEAKLKPWEPPFSVASALVSCRFP
jgi:hypothetical protein